MSGAAGTGSAWTAAQDAALLQAIREGMSFGGAALLLAGLPGDAGRPKVSRSACIGRYARLTAPADPSGGAPRRIKAGAGSGAAARQRARKAPLPASPPSPAESVAPAADIAFLDAPAGNCRFPMSGTGCRMRVCAAAAVPGRPYCADHMRLAYVPVPVRPGRPASSGVRARSGMATGGVA